MKVVYALVSPVLFSAIFCALPAAACWVSLSTGELVEQADLIVIGEINGISEIRQLDSMWMTFWEVEAGYFLKGDAQNSPLMVATPGAHNKQPQISIYYRLNEWGNTVLIFLTRRDGYFEPISPQGVVALSLKDAAASPENLPGGEYLMQKYAIVDRKTSEEAKAELEQYIKGLPGVVVAPVAGDAGSGSRGGLQAGQYMLTAVMLLLVLVGLRGRNKQ